MRLLVVCALAAISLAAAEFVPALGPPTDVSLVRTSGQSELFAVKAPSYTSPIWLAVMRGSRYQMGYDYGFMLAEENVQNFHALMDAVFPTNVQPFVFFALKAQWDIFVSKKVPAEYIEELRGIKDGGLAAGFPDSDLQHIYSIVLANIAVGDVGFNIKWLLANQCREVMPARWRKLCKDPKAMAEAFREVLAPVMDKITMQCSFYGVWGKRADGQVFTGRNLDWNYDTGISKNKLISVWKPEGKIAHATVGFAGLAGALAGMSAAGITVSEAGNDNKNETLSGFPWVLRLRHVMENAQDISQVDQIWRQHNNTLGMNHGIGSRAAPFFLALETKAWYTAFFVANDTREADLVVEGVKIGSPLPEALWRTNHGYDPEFRRTAKVRAGEPSGSSVTRYRLIHDTIQYYENVHQPVTDLQAVNISAVAGMKGDNLLSCENAAHGSNILSVAFAPSKRDDMRMMVAFEDGHAEKHLPAACNYYVVLNMSPYFN